MRATVEPCETCSSEQHPAQHSKQDSSLSYIVKLLFLPLTVLQAHHVVLGLQLKVVQVSE